MEQRLDVSNYYLSRYVPEYVEDYDEPDEREISREDLEDFVVNARQQSLLRKAPSVFGWIGFETYRARLPVEIRTIGYHTYSVQNESGEYEIVEDAETRRYPDFKALTEMTLTLMDGYNQPISTSVQATSFRQYGKRIEKR